jgi:uncharacterized membrane protein YbhN (UPF0104 family)
MRLDRKRIVISLVGLVLVGVAFGIVLPRLASYGDVWRVVRTLHPWWFTGLVGATVLNVVTFGPPWMVALPGLGFLDSLKMTQASTAVTLVVPGGAPLGMGVSYGMLRSWGFGSAEVGRAVALTGIWSQLSTFAFPFVAVVWLAAQGEGGAGLKVAALLGGILFVGGAILVAVALANPRGARFTFRVARAVNTAWRRLLRRQRPDWSEESFETFRRETVEMLRGNWRSLTGATLANQLTGYLMLDLSLRAVGIGTAHISIAESFAAWSLARLITSLPLTPGGLGLVEVGLTGLLVGFGGRNAEVVAGVLVYRFFSIVPTLVLGLAAALTWRTKQRE